MLNLKTGDLLLFNNNKKNSILNILSSLIKYGTHSNYTHIGMVLKNPIFINKSLRGTYVWESGMEKVNGNMKLGVQITPIDELVKYYNSNCVFVRQVECDSKLFSDDILKKINDDVHDKPYDINPVDWIEALIGKDLNPQKRDRFFCSALVGYIYTKCGLLKSETDWSILTPSDFSLDGEKLDFMENVKLGDSEILYK